MKKTKIVKPIIILTIALILLLSIAKNLNLTTKHNLFNQTAHSQSPIKEDNPKQNNQEDQIVNSNSTEPENSIFAEISSKEEGVPVLLQDDKIQNDYYGYVINGISISKKLGDFSNPYDTLGYVDKQGNTVGAYSYLIINVTIECFQREETYDLYLNTLRIKEYKGAECLDEYEALTSNNTVSITSKSSMKVVMEKGDKKDFNVVFLVEDKYINDPDMDSYLWINNRGATTGDDIENKLLVKIDTKEGLQ